MNQWKDEFKAHSRVKCPNSGCWLEFPSIYGLKYHYQRCQGVKRTEVCVQFWWPMFLIVLFQCSVSLNLTLPEFGWLSKAQKQDLKDHLVQHPVSHLVVNQMALDRHNQAWRLKNFPVVLSHQLALGATLSLNLKVFHIASLSHSYCSFSLPSLICPNPPFKPFKVMAIST